MPKQMLRQPVFAIVLDSKELFVITITTLIATFDKCVDRNEKIRAML